MNPVATTLQTQTIQEHLAGHVLRAFEMANVCSDTKPLIQTDLLGFMYTFKYNS